MTAINIWDDVDNYARYIQEDTNFVVRETYMLQNLITTFNDMRGSNLRKNYTYNQMSAATLVESTDLTSSTFAGTANQTLTPVEIGLMAMVSDQRAESMTPENTVTDVARELGFACGDLIEGAIYKDFKTLTGGSLGGTATAITFTILANAIALCRYANKSSSVPLACVVHGYHWNILAKSASIAGATVATAPGYIDEITRTGYVGTFMGVPLYQIYQTPTTGGTAVFAQGAVFPRDALAIDWRRPIRVEGQRDASMRGSEFTCSAVFAHGIWQPTKGVYFNALAETPS